MADVRGKVVTVIDDRPLSRARTVELLRDWARSRDMNVAEGDFAALGEISACADHGMVVLNQDGGRIGNLRSGPIRVAVSLCCCPVVVLLERDDPVDIVEALRLGARGVVTANTSRKQAVAALDFVLAGGTYVPVDVLRLVSPTDAPRHVPRLPPFAPTDEKSQVPRDPADGNDGPCDSATPMDQSAHKAGPPEPVGAAETRPRAPDCTDELDAPDDGSLTPRQIEVLGQLRLGRSNKEIARELHLSEPTVKVHVRQVIRKLGVSNRTQAALRFSIGLARSPVAAFATRPTDAASLAGQVVDRPARAPLGEAPRAVPTLRAVGFV